MICLISYIVIALILMQYQFFKWAYEEGELKDILISSVFWVVSLIVFLIEKSIDFYTRHFHTPYWLAFVFTYILELRKTNREHVLRTYFLCKAYKKYGRESFRYGRVIKRATAYWLNKNND